MPRYDVRLYVEAWVDTEVEAESETQAKELALQKCHPNQLTYGNFWDANAKLAEAQT